MQETRLNIHIGRPELAAYAALLALALFQLGFAMHQAEHSAADLGDTCALCSHYDNIDETLAAAQTEDISPSTDRVAATLPSLVRADTRRHPNKVRAPPAA